MGPESPALAGRFFSLGPPGRPSKYNINRLIIKIVSRDYGAWEVPHSPICKLEAQGSQWYRSILVHSPENQGGYISLFQGRRKPLSGSHSQAEGVNLPSFCLLLSADPQRIGQGPPTLGRTICFTSHFSQKHSHRHTYKLLSCLSSWFYTKILKMYTPLIAYPISTMHTL